MLAIARACCLAVASFHAGYLVKQNKLNSPFAKQARSNEIEAQLAETTQRLKQLQDQKEQLEARNAVLEKVSHFSMKQTSTPSTDMTDQVVQPYCVSC